MAEAIVKQPAITGQEMIPMVQMRTNTSNPANFEAIVQQPGDANEADISLNVKPIRDTVTTSILSASATPVTKENQHIFANGYHLGLRTNNYNGTPLSHLHSINHNGQTVTTVNYPITLVQWTEFISNPSIMHGLFDDTPGSLNYDPEKVMVLLGPKDDELVKSARTLHVKTVEDFIRVRNDIMSKPVLWQTRLTYRQRFFVIIPRGIQKILDLTDRAATINNKTTFAVLLDAKHPAVADKFTAKFNEAREMILRGDNFCLELSLTDCFDEWYAAHVHTEPLEDLFNTETRGNQPRAICCTNKRFVHCNRRYLSENLGTRIYITNTSPYEHGFDCDDYWCSSRGYCYWIWSAPCYMCYRSHHTKDLICSVDVDTPILHRTTSERQRTPLELLASAKTNTPIVDPFAAPISEFQDHGRPQYNGPIHFTEDMCKPSQRNSDLTLSTL